MWIYFVMMNLFRSRTAAMISEYDQVLIGSVKLPR